MLLLDVFVLDDLQVIEESKSKGTMKVRGTFQRAEEANSNNRVYPKSVLEGQITKLQPLITERRLCGELDHPQSDTVRLSNASHLVTKLWMKDNEVFGEAEVLNTPAGKVAQALISDGVKIGISSRGLGTLSEGVYGKTKTVNDDFRLVTFDLVADPSTRGAYPSLSESVMYTDEKYKRTLDQAVSEKVFLTVLKNTLNEKTKRPAKKKDIVDFGDLVNGKGDKAHSKKDRVKEDQRWDPFEEKAQEKFDTVLLSMFRNNLTETFGVRRPKVNKGDLASKKAKLAATMQKRLEKERKMSDTKPDDASLKERGGFGMGDTPLNRKAVAKQQAAAAHKATGIHQTAGDSPEHPENKAKRLAKEKAARERKAAGGSSSQSTPKPKNPHY